MNFNRDKDPMVAFALLLSVLAWLAVAVSLVGLMFRWVPFDTQTLAVGCAQLAMAVGMWQWALSHGYNK